MAHPIILYRGPAFLLRAWIGWWTLESRVIAGELETTIPYGLMEPGDFMKN